MIVVENASLDLPLIDYRWSSFRKRLFRGWNVQNLPQKRVLDHISLTVEAGSSLGVIGRNGAGKSTLLRLLAGIYLPSSGSVRVLGRANPLLELNLGIPPELTGREAVFARADLLGLGRKTVARSLDEIIEFADLGPAIDDPVRTYSSGMLIRLGFAISTSFQPEILIMDEWLSVGDSHFRERAQERLKHLAKNSTVFVLASHSVSLLNELCESAVWLHEGKIREIGDSETVLKSYQSD